MVSLGTRIRELRQERGLTQEQLGEKLLMRKSTISDYENDVIDIKISVLREIAVALHVYPDYFLKGDDLNPKIRDAVFALSSITDERLIQKHDPRQKFARAKEAVAITFWELSAQ